MPRSRSVLDAEPSMYPILRACWRFGDLGSLCVNYALNPKPLNQNPKLHDDDGGGGGGGYEATATSIAIVALMQQQETTQTGRATRVVQI